MVYILLNIEVARRDDSLSSWNNILSNLLDQLKLVLETPSSGHFVHSSAMLLWLGWHHYISVICFNNHLETVKAVKGLSFYCRCYALSTQHVNIRTSFLGPGSTFSVIADLVLISNPYVRTWRSCFKVIYIYILLFRRNNPFFKIPKNT